MVWDRDHWGFKFILITIFSNLIEYVSLGMAEQPLPPYPGTHDLRRTCMWPARPSFCVQTS